MSIATYVTLDPKTVALLLRGLAFDVEASPVLAARVLDALMHTGLLDDDAEPSSEHSAQGQPASLIPPDLLGLYAARIDLPTLFRLGGEAQIRERLAMLPLAGLRRVIQTRHLDPARETARLRSTAKLIDFIVDRTAAQVERDRELARNNSWML